MRLLVVLAAFSGGCLCSAGVTNPSAPCRGGECDAGPDAAQGDGGGDDDAGARPDGSVPDASRCDECLVARTLSFDTSFDFLSGAPVLDATEVDPDGRVGLAGYHTGALLVTGYPGAAFEDASDATWEDATSGEASGRRFDASANRTFSEPIPGLSLAGEETHVLAWEGEVYLSFPGEVYTLTLDASARGFLEVLDDGEWRRVANAEGVSAEGTVENGPIAGWRPLRIAVAVTGGAGRMTLQYESARQARVVVPPASLRAAATAIRGLRLVGFDSLDLVAEAEETLDAEAVAHDWPGGGPDDLGLADLGPFSLQWTGQVRIDVGGSYRFHVVASGGQRLFVDGLPVLDAWGTAASDETGSAMDLSTGWHDADLEFESAGGPAEVEMAFADGSADLAGVAIPSDRFRPVTASRPGELREANGASYAFGNGGITEVSSPLEVAGPSDATATTVDLSFRIVHDDQDQVVVELQSPLGTRVTVRDRVPGVGIRNVTVEDLDDFAGETIDGTWRVWATDEVAGVGGVLENVTLTVHYRAPLALYARSGAYSTRVVDLTDGIVSYGEARWAAEEKGGDVEVRTRSCPTEASCALGGWSEPLPDPDGSPIDSDVRRFLQLRAELSGDGQTTSWLDSLEMDYEAYDAECVCP